MPSGKMGSHMDPQLVEKIVHEVKSQGAFDEFRKDSMADVDTKPAYQNLRQRVENTVKKFLAEQHWTPETNKYQLRERLRKYITESGFLDVGVERIVDQVVNPKIGSVFQPRIEEIAYKFLGVPPPQIKCEPPPPIMPPLPPLPLNGAALKVETCSLLPTDLEQVSPDSDKATLKSECKDEEQSMTDMELDEKVPDDDDESPPFEPLVKCASPVKPEANSKNVHRDSDMETSNDNPPLKLECIAQTSGVPSGVTYQAVDTETQYSTVSTNMAELDSEKEASRSFDVDVAASQESQLSQVSSDSHISTTTPPASHSFIESSCVPQRQTEQAQVQAQAHAQALEVAAVNISEEAQMPNFNENSNDARIDGRLMVSQLHFDIKKDEIKFEGTERKTNIIQREGDSERDDNRDGNIAAIAKNGDTEKNYNPHQFCSLKAEAEDTPAATPTLSTTPTPNAQDSSFGSSLEDVSNQQYLESSGVPNEAVVPLSKAQPLESKDTSGAARGHSSSSSSSRHKKHSKDKRRSHDNKDNHKSKGREKERERERSHSDRHSRSKHTTTGSSSSNSKRSASSVGTQPHVTGNGGKSEKTGTSKQTISASSSSSSSRSECHDAKRDKRDGDRKHQRANSAIKKSDRKSEAVVDDHNTAKEKTHRRKSTDSNDEDKSAGGANGAAGKSGSYQSHRTPSSTQNSKFKSKNGSGSGSGHSTKYTRNDGKLRTEAMNADLKDAMDQLDVDANANECLPQQRRNKVVILNDILQNPSTNFIALASSATTCMNHVRVVRNVSVAAAAVEDVAVNNCAGSVTAAKSESDLLFLEEESGQFTMRLRLLDHAMDRCRRVVNNLRFDCAAGGSESLYEPLGTPPESNESTQASLMLVEDVAVGAQVQAKATLMIECMASYSDDDAVCGALMARSEGDTVQAANDFRNSQVLQRKRQKRDDNCVHDKPSPTPSEGSINSKENVVFERNADELKQHKLNQQRYTSEDLYKPRPILSQRSRRRGVDSIV